MFLSSSIIHHLVMITYISYEIIITYISTKIDYYCSTLSLCNPCSRFHQTLYTEYSGLEWSNINTFWYKYGRYISIVDAGNHYQMVNY